ncbi:MAG: hypothetical protein IJC15_04160, partial [Clostridia bacterium]|nr:hypothetical protein [Clostridia bacterium]
MKRKLALILAALMLCMTFTACASEGGSEGQTTTASAAVDTTAPSAETTAPVDEGPADPLPADLKFEGETVRFLARDRDWMDDEIAVDDINGEVVNDAIFKRNQTVEDRLGIKITTFKTGGTDQYAISDLLKTLVLSGSDEYDIFHNSVYSTIMYTGDNIFHDLYQFEYLNLENPWWSQGFNAEASIGNAQYMATGDISLSLKRMTFVTFFNQQLFKNFNIENIYDVVRDGKWTLEYKGNIAAQMYQELNGNQQKYQEDAYGFMTNGDQIGVDAYWSSCDLDILKKTADNDYEYAVNIERLAQAVSAINKLIWENEGSWSVPKGGSDKEQDTIAQLFAAGNVGMVTLRLMEAEGTYLRDMKDAYGIIPIPKLDETIEAYYSYAHDQFNAFGIPLTLKEDRYDVVGAAMEYM